MDSVILLLLILGFCYIVFFISIIGKALTLKDDGKRIADLLVIGTIIYIIHILPDELVHVLPIGSHDRTAFSGFLIFMYGFLLLLYRKFREGLAD